MRSNIDLSKGLVFAESFNGIQSITDNGGTITGNLEFGMEKGHQYASFDGTNDYINYGNTDKTDVYGAISISAWMYVNLSGNIEGYIAKSSGTSASSIQYYLYKQSSGRVYGGVCTTAAGAYLGYYDITISGWYHFVCMWSGSGSASLYCNASKGTDGTAFSGTQNRLGNLVFGAFNSGGSYKANCKLSDVRIYNRALSAQEVSLLYKQGLNKMPNNVVQDEKLGSNIITNGTFDTDTSGWSVASGTSATLDWQSNKFLRITCSTSWASAYQTTLTVGKTYKVSFRYKSDGLAGASLGSSGGGNQYWGGNSFTQSTWTLVTLYIYASTTVIHLAKYSSATGVYVDFDDIVIQEVLQPSGKLIFNLNANNGVIRDNTGNTTLTSTNVTVVKQGSIYAMKFNGTDSKIDTGSDWIGTKACTISAWVKYYSVGENSAGTIISNQKVRFFHNSISRMYFSSDFGSTTAISGVGHLSSNLYYNIIITRTSSGVVNFYISGTISGTVNQSSGTPIAGTTNVIIGNISTQSQTFDGLISQVQVWDRVFTAEEVSQVFNAQRRLYGV